MKQLGLRYVSVFTLPRGLLRDIQSALQEGGVFGEERFVLLTGRREKDESIAIRTATVPVQIPSTHERGLSVTVPGSELQRLNIAWAARNEQLVAQVHSHPTFPYHSTTDDRYSMVTIEGGLSIVVPLFGYCALADLRSCAVFRLLDARWEWLSSREVDRLIRLV
jgi:hypothetical protein